MNFLANHVKLVNEIKSAKYPIMCDTTSEFQMFDQMSEVIRYEKFDNRKVDVNEVFLGKKTADL